MTETQTIKIESKIKKYGISIEEMAKNGLAFGHKTSRLHPKMAPYVALVKDGVHVIDLNKTADCLTTALEVIENLIKEGKSMILVGTKPHFKELVKSVAEECGLCYVNERWIGGTFTNFPEIKKRIDYFKKLEEQTKSQDFSKYTKKEQLKILKEVEKLRTKFEGIKKLEKLPDLVFVLDIKKDLLAVQEAKKKGVNVIAIVDTNVDPSLIDYPIPANDDAMSSVKYILDKIKDVIKNTKPEIKNEKQ